MKATARSAIENGKTKDIALELTANPIDGMNVIKGLFEGDFKCMQVKGECMLIVTDMEDYPKEFGEFYRKFSDKTLVFRDNVSMLMNDRKKHLTNAIESMKGIYSEDVIKAEKKKISKLKREFDFITYMMDTKWFEDYKKKVAVEMKEFAGVLQEGLTIKMNELMKIDLSSEKARNRTHRSCQLASYVKSTLDSTVTYQKFNEARLKIIDNFKSKFLPKLSGESARDLAQLIRPENFYLIDENVNYHPPRLHLGAHSEGYKEPTNSIDIVKDLSLLQKGLKHRCDVKGMLVKDAFNFGTDTIYVSKYVLANGYSDAMSHELGHWLSAQIKHKRMSSHSRRKLLKARDCISDFYPKEKRKSAYALNHKGDHFHTEEDFADWFTAHAGLGESGLFCDLKKMVNNFVGTVPGGTYVPHEGDSHSNYLFREINIRMHRNETLPQSCKNLVDYYSEYRPGKCEL